MKFNARAEANLLSKRHNARPEACNVLDDMPDWLTTALQRAYDVGLARAVAIARDRGDLAPVSRVIADAIERERTSLTGANDAV